MEENDKLQLLQGAILSGNIPQMVLNVISYALDSRASDIHIEPKENVIRLRYRIDGVLREIVEYPHNIHPAVVSRIKIMSNLKIDEQRMPQDGRATVTTKDNREMDLRVSTLPTVRGEKVVMRIQDKSRKIPDLVDLGLQGRSLSFFEDALKLPNGIILTTGPTGSGKTTTMYSAMTRLNKVDVNIMTIEDPVEIQMDGLNQSQVHADIDYTFASGLRTALRQDPDIIMVGEIRDHETINIAIEASLTGHLVLSTIHTNSAVETITRILNMEIPGFLLASAVELIIAQRLVRRLCDSCKVRVEPEADVLELVKKGIANIGDTDEIEPEKLKALEFYGPKGCEECDDIGYKGRLGLYEIMRMNNDIRAKILNEASTVDIEVAAIASGMITLEQSGIIKCLKGQTSLDEVYRVAKKMESPVGGEKKEPPKDEPEKKEPSPAAESEPKKEVTEPEPKKVLEKAKPVVAKKVAVKVVKAKPLPVEEPAVPAIKPLSEMQGAIAETPQTAPPDTAPAPSKNN